MNLEYTQDNLILRVLSPSDCRLVYDFYYNNREQFDMYESDKPDNFYTLSFIDNLLKAEYTEFLHGKYARFFLFDKTKPMEIIGCVSFSDIKRSMKSCFIGYKIDKKYQHMGYGRRMLNMSLKIMVSEAKMHRIEAYIHPDNLISLKLAKSLGFIDEGVAYQYAMIDKRWQDHLRYVFISQ